MLKLYAMFESEPLADSEDKIIERLGDCDVPVDYMDLVNHRIRCRKIEIFHYDDKVSFTPNTADEEEEQLEMGCGPKFSEDHTDDEDRILQLAKDLDCLIRRIEQMQMVIKDQKKQQHLESGLTEATTEQVKELIKLKVDKSKIHKEQQEQKKDPSNGELNCEELMIVRNLQHGHHRLQCEINVMICNYRLLRDLLKKLCGQLSQENQRCCKLSAVIFQFQEWSQQVAMESPVCKERYQSLLQKKLTKTEAARVIKANTAKAYRRSKTFLSKHQLRFDLREFLAEIDELQEYADDLRQEMGRRFTHIEYETTFPHVLVDSISSQRTSLKKERLSEKDKLFG